MMRFLLSWLGVWPAAGVLRVAPSARRMLPDAEGVVHPLMGVVSPHGAALSVSPLRFAEVRRAVAASARPGTGLGPVLAALPAALGQPDAVVDLRPLVWTATPLRLRPVASTSPSRVTVLPRSPWGVELRLAPGLDVRTDAEALAAAADRAVGESRVALFSYIGDDARAAVTAEAAGFDMRPWQLVQLRAPAG